MSKKIFFLELKIFFMELLLLFIDTCAAYLKPIRQQVNASCSLNGEKKDVFENLLFETKNFKEIPFFNTRTSFVFVFFHRLLSSA